MGGDEFFVRQGQ